MSSSFKFKPLWQRKRGSESASAALGASSKRLKKELYSVDDEFGPPRSEMAVSSASLGTPRLDVVRLLRRKLDRDQEAWAGQLEQALWTLFEAPSDLKAYRRAARELAGTLGHAAKDIAPRLSSFEEKEEKALFWKALVEELLSEARFGFFANGRSSSTHGGSIPAFSAMGEFVTADSSLTCVNCGETGKCKSREMAGGAKDGFSKAEIWGRKEEDRVKGRKRARCEACGKEWEFEVD